jgi:hypothetical protein
MSQMCLNLNLPPQLMLDGGTKELPLLQDLDGHNELCAFLTGKVDGAEFPTPQLAANVEVVEGPDAVGREGEGGGCLGGGRGRGRFLVGAGGGGGSGGGGGLDAGVGVGA